MTQMPMDAHQVAELLADRLAPEFSLAARLDALRRRESLTEAEVSELYGYSAKTLRNWRSLGRGPAFIKDGKLILYRQRDVRLYQEARRVRTADAR